MKKINLLIVIFLPLLTFAKDLELDLSGEDGFLPKDGVCCEYMEPTTSLTEDPRRGDNAVPGGPGEHANNLDMELRDTGGQNGHVVVYGTVYEQDDYGNQTIVKTIEENIPLTASIIVDATGGEGAPGAKGGQGQSACDGKPGSEGDDDKDPGDGGDGCNSGGGGDDAPARDGGNGGIVRFYIPADQTHLALLVSADVSAGEGGEPSTQGGGYPGVPGKYGPGGPQYDYISHYEDRECPEPSSSGSSNSSTDDDDDGGGVKDLGNGYDSFESNAEPYVYQPTIAEVLGEIFGPSAAMAAEDCGKDPVWAHKDAGKDGEPGEEGPRGRAFLEPGDRGDDGKMEFIVVEPNGKQTTYKKPFYLTIKADILDTPYGNGDGVFEPNEELSISNIRIRNNNKMPSPAQHVILSLQSAQWIMIDPLDKVEIPQIMGESEVTLDASFKVKVKNSFSSQHNKDWTLSDTLVTKGEITRINRTLEGLKLPKTVHMSFPITMTPIQSVSVIGPGESAEIQWRIENKTGQDFKGLKGAERRIQTGLSRVGGDAFKNTIEGFEMEGNEAEDSHRNFLRTLTQLKANDPVIISGQIKFSSEAEPYTYVDLASTLSLDVIGTNDMRQIMSRSFRIRISQTYTYTPGATVLLLTNTKTDKGAFDAWKKIISDLGLIADVWDVSYYKELNLIKDLVDAHKGESLLKNYTGGTFVLLNNTQASEKLRNIRMLHRSQFYQAASENNINFYVVGGNKRDLQSQLIGMHLKPNQLDPRAANNFEGFLNVIQGAELSGGSRVTVRAKNAQDYLEAFRALRERPQKTHSLVYSRDGRGVSLALVPTLSPLKGGMVALAADDHDVASENFVLSDKNIRPFVLSLSLTDKVKSLMYVLKNSKEKLYLKPLTSTLIHDLIERAYHYQESKEEHLLAEIAAVVENLKALRLSNEYIARVMASLKYFSQVSGDNELGVFGKGHQKDLQELVDTYTGRYKKFSEKRKEILRDEYEIVFDAYKMFTLPAIGKAVSGQSVFLMKPAVYEGGLQ